MAEYHQVVLAKESAIQKFVDDVAEDAAAASAAALAAGESAGEAEMSALEAAASADSVEGIMGDAVIILDATNTTAIAFIPESVYVSETDTTVSFEVPD